MGRFSFSIWRRWCAFEPENATPARYDFKGGFALMSRLSRWVLFCVSALSMQSAWAADAPTAPSLMAVDKISAGDTAWMLTSTALVLMMSVPGLALFYGGMVRKKNVLST